MKTPYSNTAATPLLPSAAPRSALLCLLALSAITSTLHAAPPPGIDLPSPGNEAATTGAPVALPSAAAETSTGPVTLRVLEPAPDTLLPATGPSTVTVRVAVQNHTLRPGGNRIHVVLDNRRSELLYDTAQPVTFDNVQPGGHTLRVFAVRANGELCKDPGAFILENFYLGQRDNRFIPEPDEPILTLSSPRGEAFVGPAAALITLDYDVEHAPLKNTGYRLRYILDGLENFATQPGPFYLSGLKDGKHNLIAEVVDMDDRPIPGMLNRVEVPFTIQHTPGLPTPPSAPAAPAAAPASTPARP